MKFKKTLVYFLCLMLSVATAFRVCAAETDSEEETEEEEASSDSGISSSDIGDAGMSAYNASVLAQEDDAQYTVFTLDVGEAYTTETYIVYFCEIDTYQEYYVEFYASQDYMASVVLPAGNYYFTSGGPENDYMSIYTIADPEYFTVYDDQVNYITITIRSRAETLTDTEDEEEEEEEVIEEAEEEPEEETAAKVPWYIYFLAGIVLMAAGIGICVVMYKKSKDEQK